MTEAAQLSFDENDDVRGAVAWREENPRAWQALLSLALQDVAAGSQPCIDLHVNIMRRPHIADALGLCYSDAAFLINNNLRAELSRLLNREYDLGYRTRKRKCEAA